MLTVGGLGDDGERLFHRADFEDDLHVDGLGDRHDDVVLDVLLEPLQFDGDAVRARQQVRRLEQALFVGRGQRRRSAGGVGDGDGRSRHRR